MITSRCISDFISFILIFALVIERQRIKIINTKKVGHNVKYMWNFIHLNIFIKLIFECSQIEYFHRMILSDYEHTQIDFWNQLDSFNPFIFPRTYRHIQY